MSDNTPQPILNPIVYLNYLQPSVALEYEVARDVFLVTFGALLWDVLSSIPNDRKLIQTSKPSPVLFAYFASRTFALAVVLMSALAKIGPVRNCGVMELILSVFWVLTSGSSSYLFLKRLHALFFQDRLVYHAFTAFWVAEIGASMVVLPGPLHDYYQIANTAHCMNVKIKSYVAVAFIVPVLFDACVYFAISYKILMFHRTKKFTNWKSFCYGAALPRLSQAVLKGGQQYYTISTTVNITVIRTILAVSPNISPVLQLSPLVPAVALTSTMACRVYRNLKLEAQRETEIETLTTVRFANRDPEGTNVHLSQSTGVVPAVSGSEQC